MSVSAYFPVYLVAVWLAGYALGRIFLNVRQFVEKAK